MTEWYGLRSTLPTQRVAASMAAVTEDSFLFLDPSTERPSRDAEGDADLFSRQERGELQSMALERDFVAAPLQHLHFGM